MSNRINEGIMGQLNRQLAGKLERKCDIIQMNGVENRAKKDSAGNICNNIYYIKDGKTETLKALLLKLIEIRGPEGNFNDIDVSNIKKMYYLDNKGDFVSIFSDIKDFNGDISGWDVSNVESMLCMFGYCEKFNCDISGWDVSNVRDMSFMFKGCKSFDQDLSRWNVTIDKYIDKELKTLEVFDFCPIKESHKPIKLRNNDKEI